MIEVVICEDNHQELKTLEAILQKELPSFFPSYSLRTYTSGKDFRQGLESGDCAPSLVFLDIFLEDTTGVAIAKHLRNQKLPLQIIFITSSREYIMESYQLNAAYYILKPVSREWVREALSRAAQGLQSSEDFLTITSNHQQYRIPQNVIHYVETFGNKTSIYTAKETFFVYKPLKKIMEELNPQKFLLIQRGILTHMDYIQSLQNNICTLKNGHKYSLSRKNEAALKEQYFDYIFKNA